MTSWSRWAGRLRYRPETVALVGLAAAALVIQGWRVLGPPWLDGDAQFHAALAQQVLRGSLLPEGFYAGVPSWYPPAFHWLLAAFAVVLRTDPYGAIRVLSVLAIPLLPLTSYWLARRVGMTPAVAVLSAVIATFGGGWVTDARFLWVFSFFVSGHNFYPVYPRDLALALLPLVIGCIGVPGVRSYRAAALGGLIAGLCLLLQPQAVVPLAIAAVPWFLLQLREPARRQFVGVLLVAGISASLVAGWWFVELILTLQKAPLNVSSPFFSAPTLQLTDYPAQFGVVLPLAAAGALIAWRRPQARLVVWAFVVPFIIGFLYRPGEPLGDYLGSDRMWLSASVAAAPLGALAIEAVYRRLVSMNLRSGRWAAVVVSATLLVAAVVPATSANWNRDQAALATHFVGPLDTSPTDGVSTFIRSLPGGTVGPILAGPEASLNAWFNAGWQVLSLEAPGWSKIGFDPAPLTGLSIETRRVLLANALSGSFDELASVAISSGVHTVVLERDGDLLGLVDALPDSPNITATSVVENNGWSQATLDGGHGMSIRAHLQGQAVVRLTFKAPSTVSVTLRSGETIIGAGQAEPDSKTWSQVDIPFTLAEPIDSVDLTASDKLIVSRIQVFEAAQQPTALALIGEVGRWAAFGVH